MNLQVLVGASLLPGVNASTSSPPSEQPSVQVLRDASSSTPPIVSEGAGTSSLNNPSSNNDQVIPDDWVDLHDNTGEDFVDVGLPSAPTTATATADEGDPSSSPSPLLPSPAPAVMAGNSHDLGPSSPSSTSVNGTPGQPDISSQSSTSETPLQAAHHHNGDSTVAPPSSSSRGRLRKPSQRFIESSDPSTSAWGRSTKRYVSSSATSDIPTLDYDAAHDEHLRYKVILGNYFMI